MLTHTNCSHLFAALISVFLIAFFAAASGSAHAQEDDAGTINAAAIHPQLAQQLNLAEGPVSFLIILDDQVDVAGESAQSGLISVAATKLGQGTPWLGVARFSGDPCAQSAVGVDDIGDFVDVLMEDLSAIDSLEVTVGYTEVGENPALYWCEPMASGAGSLAARSIGSTRPSS